MNRKIIAILVANAFALPAYAQSEFKLLEGFVGLGGMYTQKKDTLDAAYLNEYQDLSNGAAGYFGLNGRSDTYWAKGYGENIGRDDMYVDLRGGMYNLFSARLYTNWLTHNFGWGPYGARSPYVNPTDSTMLGRFPAGNSNVPPWTSYDMKYDRRIYGAEAEWKSLSPWYGRFDFNQVQFDGNKLYAAAQGTSPGNGFIDLAGPVNYTTNNFTVEGGYASRDMVFSVAALWSKFENNNGSFQWVNGYFGNGLDQTFEAPTNDYFKVSANGSLRNLPLRSTISARFTYAMTENSVDLATRALNGTNGAYSPTNPNVLNFEGKQENTTFALSWTAVPTATVDTKVYYNYYDRSNESPTVIYNAPTTGLPPGGNIACGGLPCDAPYYQSTRNNAGAEVWWRFLPNNRIMAGYDWNNIEREDYPYDDTTNQAFTLQYRNTMLADTAIWAKYTYNRRRSNFIHGDLGTGPSDPLFLQRFTSTFDASNLDQNLFKIGFDTALGDAGSFSLEAIYKDNNYKDIVLGRTADTRYEYYASVNVGAPKTPQLSFFADYETVTIDAYHRSISNLTAPGAYNPFAPPNSSNYNWSNTNRDRNYLLGAALVYPLSETLKLTASYMYSQQDGSADFVSQNNFGSPVPITAYPNYNLNSLNLRGDWAFARNWTVSGGYTYQKYAYSDIQWDNFRYLAPPPPNAITTTTSYLSGVNAFPQYNVNIFWLIGTYRF